MVKKEQSKRQKSIKSKLLAAVCMLLVSCIMMVSSTYAWFTLSTAPEVTGITTAVGANGNLEMALLPTSGVLADITTSAGDSVKDWSVKNTTWGNLVNLETGYGLDQITLYPAQLNVATWTDTTTKLNPATIAGTILSTPTYGSDGRVDTLVANTVTSIYDSSDENFPQASGFGVRAVGTASGMTDRQLAYRNTRSSASTAMAQAKTFASQSLNVNGATLANVALKKATSPDATYVQADVAALQAIVTDLLGEGDTVGVLEHIENAYLNYILAYGASKSSGLTDDQFKLFQGVINDAADVYDAVTDLAAAGTEIGATVTLPAELTDPLNLLKATREKVESAQTDLTTLAGYGADAQIAWSNSGDTLGISTPLYKLADTDAMEINGYAANTVKDNMSAIVNSVASQGLNVVIASGGGVYADIADHCGDYNASIVIKEVSYGGLTLENMNARMSTDTNVTDPVDEGGKGLTDVYLGVLGKAVEGAGAPDSAGGQVMPISDMYGYIIDLAFRTNAAESKLLLQVDPEDRIYSDNAADAETMGHGSTMTFTSTTTDFTVKQMVELMKAIRIVFFDPNGNVVRATAKLDLAEGNYETVGGNTVTAKMYIYTMTGSGGTTYTKSEDTEAQTGVTYYELLDADKYVAVTTLADGDSVVGYYTVGADADTYTEVESGSYSAADSITYYVKHDAGSYLATTFDANKTLYVETTATTTTETKSTDNAIMSLTQNTATALSVLVYLDGNYVGNEDVAATAATSMTGEMNLQFASSANLVPMNYTPLISQTGTTTGGTDDTATTYNVTVPTGVTGETTATAGQAYTFTLQTGYTLGEVTVGGTAVTPTNNNDGTYTIPAASVTGAIVINVTAT